MGAQIHTLLLVSRLRTTRHAWLIDEVWACRARASLTWKDLFLSKKQKKKP